MMDNDTSPTLIDLRPRNRGNGGTTFGSANNQAASTSAWSASANGKDEDRVFIEHAVQPSDSLYKVGLLYSVPVSEIRRVNNIVADHEIHGLKFVKVPVTRLRQQLLTEKAAMQATAQNEAPIIDIHQSASTTPQVAVSDKLNLLGDSTDDERNEEESGSHKSAIEAYLNKADSTMAHCRNQLPSPSLESGAFHFVNASAPDNAVKGTWLLVLGVVLMFVVIPLFLTMLEESHEAHHQVHHSFSST